ncbi:J domain-containing protein required for chloroplast accumulation response 1 isoform X1 [Cajanus cajan]|uniref:J domain-containing protein required for chloroplast accumulation response 1 isoform X1 n=1 Tax=Cajanus cajan TaxID=3821 RepID=UPI00098DD1C8|nr:J domain-containing protein required for chloroplast accumulation response 1 isoform X1 [Cajanus cajan]
MERFPSSERESIVLGYRESESLIGRSSSSNSMLEVDFKDVFGGPPRRSSMNEGERGWCRWPPERVFGEESGNRRRNDDFFDDIFGGEESASVCSTPNNNFALSRVSSPLPSAPHSLPSLPLPFSLPAKLTNGVDLPTFGSPNNTSDASNGYGLSDSHLSRFSPHRKELKNELKPYRQSLLSQEFSNSSTSDKADKGSIMKQDISIGDVSPNTSNSQFHFSIYKWASKGVPMMMPLRTERTSRTKDKVKLERCSSAKEWRVGETTTQNPVVYNDSSLMSNRKQDVSTTSTATENRADSNQIVEQVVSAKAQSGTSSIPQTDTKDVEVESSNHSGKTEAARETQKLESKPLQFLFKESEKKLDNDMITRERDENRMKSTKKLSAVFDVTVNPMKQEEKTVFSRDVGHTTSQGSLRLGENMGKGLVKGKVKEFARIFNQEAVTKPKVDSKSLPQGSTYKQRDALKTNNEVESVPEQSKKENSAMETTNISANNLSHQNDISAQAAIPDISFTVIGDKDESFNGSFMIQVLDEDEGEVLQNQENQEIQMIDNKIRQWSKGKEGNIRSLLSTLQYVLWPECGWKPVPLVDIIEGNAVKRAYQRALLCLHPDKLQQKGASSDKKYIAEKVFDILQEAWTQFNMLGAL